MISYIIYLNTLLDKYFLSFQIENKELLTINIPFTESFTIHLFQ